MKILYFWKSILWLALICYGLFIPAGNLPSKPFINIPHFDKMVHFTLFFVFCLLLFMPIKKLKQKYFIWAPIISITLGAILEFGQRILTTSRASDFYDFLANTSGIFAAVFFFYLFVNNKKWEILF